MAGRAPDKSNEASNVSDATPPCVPWEKLMVQDEHQEPTEEQKKMRTLHETLLSSLQDEEAKDLVTALVFLSTRSTKQDKTQKKRS